MELFKKMDKFWQAVEQDVVSVKRDFGLRGDEKVEPFLESLLPPKRNTVVIKLKNTNDKVDHYYRVALCEDGDGLRDAIESLVRYLLITKGDLARNGGYTDSLFERKVRAHGGLEKFVHKHLEVVEDPTANLRCEELLPGEFSDTDSRETDHGDCRGKENRDVSLLLPDSKRCPEPRRESPDTVCPSIGELWSDGHRELRAGKRADTE